MKKIAAMCALTVLLAACQTTPPTGPVSHGINPANAAALRRTGQAVLRTQAAPAIISNGTVQLGINDLGSLNVPGPASATGTTQVGIRYVPTNNEATGAGCACEGWGVADVTSSTSGYANMSSGTSGLTLVSFTSTAATAVSVVDAAGKFRVTHDYHPSATTPNMYEVTVTIQNTSDADVVPRYRRNMDWDIEPTPYAEYVTVRRGTSPNLYASSADGFTSSDPLSPLTVGGVSDPRINMDFTDAGPDDIGTTFDFQFPALKPGASISFKTYYGAAADETSMLAALSAVGAEAYSIGQSSASSPTVGSPNTFAFAFTGIGGAPVTTPVFTQLGSLNVTVDDKALKAKKGTETFRLRLDPPSYATGPATNLAPGLVLKVDGATVPSTWTWTGSQYTYNLYRGTMTTGGHTLSVWYNGVEIASKVVTAQPYPYPG